MSKKLLYITYKCFGNVMEGGGRASKRNYDILCQIFGVEQVSPYYIHNDDRKRTLLSYIYGVIFMPLNYFFGLTPKRVIEITKMAENYEYVYIDRSVFGIIAKELKKSGYKGKVITFFHNVESFYFDAKLSRNLPLRQIIINSADRNDQYSWLFSDKVITLNARDTKILQHKFGNNTCIQIPISLEDKYKLKEYPKAMTRTRPLCLFLGTYFSANNEGILWFIKEVLPYVDIEMKIVGKGMAKLKAESPELKNIEVISDAPELQSYIEEADVMVLPIFSGSGMKVKTCESLMYGKNILGTQEAFEGYELDYAKAGALCNTAEDFIYAIKDLKQNPRPRYNRYSRQVFLKQYCTKATDVLFQNLFSQFES